MGRNIEELNVRLKREEHSWREKYRRKQSKFLSEICLQDQKRDHRFLWLAIHDLFLALSSQIIDSFCSVVTEKERDRWMFCSRRDYLSDRR
jgi:hypothetical protein